MKLTRVIIILGTFRFFATELFCLSSRCLVLYKTVVYQQVWKEKILEKRKLGFCNSKRDKAFEKDKKKKWQENWCKASDERDKLGIRTPRWIYDSISNPFLLLSQEAFLCFLFLILFSFFFLLLQFIIPSFLASFILRRRKLSAFN